MNELYTAIRLAMEKGAFKKLVLSKPTGGYPARITGRLCHLRGETTLSTESPLAGGKVLHKNYPLSSLHEETLTALLAPYRQINLITAVGDGEYKRAESGRETYIGLAALLKKLSAYTALSTADISIDRKKNYLLSGKEPFLSALGISDKTGRIYDKKQAKFRQINRFLEHVEDIYHFLPTDGTLCVLDLCCGKSYLSFAVYYYFTHIKHRETLLLGIDRKEDVIAACSEIAEKAGFSGMRFVAGDIRDTESTLRPHLVMSLHACDIATDIVLDTAARLSAEVILSTPCCQKYFEDKLSAPALSFLLSHPFLRHKLNETVTDALRTLRLASLGYKVTVSELTDPDDTPKNTLLRAVRRKDFDKNGETAKRLSEEYRRTLLFLFGTDRDFITEVTPV